MLLATCAGASEPPMHRKRAFTLPRRLPAGRLGHRRCLHNGQGKLCGAVRCGAVRSRRPFENRSQSSGKPIGNYGDRTLRLLEPPVALRDGESLPCLLACSHSTDKPRFGFAVLCDALLYSTPFCPALRCGPCSPRCPCRGGNRCGAGFGTPWHVDVADEPELTDTRGQHSQAFGHC